MSCYFLLKLKEDLSNETWALVLMPAPTPMCKGHIFSMHRIFFDAYARCNGFDKRSYGISMPGPLRCCSNLLNVSVEDGKQCFFKFLRYT